MNMNAVKQRSRFFSSSEFSLFLILAALFFFFSVSTDSFFSEYNLTNILKQATITGIIAIASTFVIIAGGIDLSVGSIAGMGSLIVALMMARLGAPVVLIIPATVVAGGLLGLFNGIIIHEFKIAPFIATLGTAQIIRGLIKLLCDAKTITGIYTEYGHFSDDRFLGIPKMALIWLLVALVAWLILRYTRFGRNTFTIGCGEEVARLSGIDIRINKYAIYMVAGIMCAIAGALLTSRINSAIPTGGAGYEMNAIAAAVIGGASLAGGRGSIIGTIIGTLLMTMISNGGIQMGIDPFIMEIVTGFLIIIAVVIDMFRSRRK